MANNLYNTLQSGLMYQIFYNKPFIYSGGGSSPTGIWVGLTSTPPTNTNISELSVSNYARQPIGTGFPTWSYPYANSGMVYNNNSVNFPVAAASWGWVSGAFISDAITNGNTLFYLTLSVPKEITANDQFFIPQSGCYVRMN